MSNFLNNNVLLSGSIVLLALSIWFSASDFQPKAYFLPPPPPLTGALALNEPKVLEKLLEGQVNAPESIVVEKDVLYTCQVDGKCIKIEGGKIVKMVPMTGHKDCDGKRSTMAHCGRPLGIRRFNANQFMVADTALGLHLVDFEKGTAETILSSNARLDGKRLQFPDDLDFFDNDTVVFSDASIRYGYYEDVLAFLEHAGDGRLVEYRLGTGQMRVLAEGVHFANGVQMHPDKQSVLFCESGTPRVHRYYLAGPKRGRQEVFVENMPGFPDNIRISASGESFYIALFAHRSEGRPDFLDRVGPWPGLRKVIGELAKVLPDFLVQGFFHNVHHSYGMVIEVDLNGQIGRSYHDPEGKVMYRISQVCDGGGDYLYLASFANNYIGRMSKN